MTSVDVALLVLRLWLAVVMLMHGINHARSLEGTSKWFASIGFKRAEMQAKLSAFGEVAIAAGLAVGLLTPFAAAGLIATMLVAFWSIHRFAGFFVFARPDEGYEYVITVAVAAFVLAVVGPGQVSLDDVFGLTGDLNAWVGAAIAAGGVLAAAGQLSMFWKKPVPKEVGGNELPRESTDA